MSKGALHVHSTYSDGEFSLQELREIFLEAGCSFVCVTDHAEGLDPGKLKAYVEDCRLLSDQRFRLIPGLEFACRERMHILGYGVTTRVVSSDPEEVIRHIRAEGGIAVIAHPRDAAFSAIEAFRELPDGIEVWNSKYDGQYAPRPGTMALLTRLRQQKPNLHAFCGLDLHWKKQFRGLLTVLRTRAVEDGEVMHALAQGAYSGCKGDLQLPSDGVVPTELLQQFAILQGRSKRLRSMLKYGQDLAGRLGISLPASVKAQLRRLM